MYYGRFFCSNRSAFLAIFVGALYITIFGTSDSKGPIVRAVGPLQSISSYQYIITIDGGSSGSRLHVHRVLGSGGTVLPKVESVFTHKLKPGLSSYELAPSNASHSIKGLLELALDQVPRAHWRKTPVFLKATAGLRTLSRNVAEEILEHCRMAIERTAFVFREEWALIISGKEEGKFGWIAANYLMERFTTKKHLGQVGVIEMGGASMQVSFVPSNGPVDEKMLTKVSLAGQDFSLYTHSFLGYGLEQAQDMFNERLGDKEPNPCLPHGASPMASGDFDKCSILTGSLLEKNKPCPKQSCSFAGVYQPSLHGVNFVAIENFYHTSEFFDVVSKPSQLDDRARIFCKEDFESIKKKYAKEKEDDLRKYCFSAAYIHGVLTTGFDLSEPFDQVQIVRDVNGVGIDWAIGSVLYEAMNLPPLDVWPPDALRKGPRVDVPSRGNRVLPEESTTSIPFIGMWVVVLPTFVVVAAFLLLRGMQRRRRYADYLSAPGQPRTF